MEAASSHRLRNGVPGSTSSDPSLLLLSHPNDDSCLSPLLCFLRQQIEIFPATEEDVKARHKKGGLKDPLAIGRVGLRCIHCRNLPHNERSVGAVSYPKNIGLIHQAVRNWQRYHYKTCAHIPQQVRDVYDDLPKKKHAAKDSDKWWIKTAKAKALEDISALGTSGVEPSSDDSAPPVGGIRFRADQEPPFALPTGIKSNALCTPTMPNILSGDVAAYPEQHDTSIFNESEENDWGTILETLEKIDVGDEQHLPSSQIYERLPCLPGSLPETTSLVTSSEAGHHTSSSNGDMATSTYAITADEQDGRTRGENPIHEKIIERVRLAHGIVQTTLSLEQMPPSPERYSSCSALDDGVSVEKSSNASETCLRALGVELYELFAGYPPALPELDESKGGGLKYADDHGAIRARKRREDDSKNEAHVPLCDLGIHIPSTLSWMVDILISGGKYTGKEGGFCYQNEASAGSDLKILIEEANKFLFQRDSELSGPTHQLAVPGLCGREKEMRELQGAYTQASQINSPCQVVLVSGDTGNGKSSLVRAVLDTLPPNGLLHTVQLKFDELVISDIFGAFGDYIATLMLMEKPDRLNQLRAAIIEAIDSAGISLLVSLIPSCARLLSDTGVGTGCLGSMYKQSSGAEFRLRLRFIARLFFRTLAGWVSKSGTALTIFMDDLQFADENSLDVLAAILTDPTLSGVLFLGSYRSDGTTEMQPACSSVSSLPSVLETLQNPPSSSPACTIWIDNLGKEHVNELVSESLGVLPRMAKPLSDLIYLRTHGNPLFVSQFLQSLVTEQKLVYSLSLRRWEWDLAAIESRPIDDNVLGLMVNKINRLSPETRLALMMASAIGNQIPVSTVKLLCLIGDQSPLALCDLLDITVDEGFMHKAASSSYQWTHDRLQEAAYSLIEENDRPSMHLLIGKQLQKALSLSDHVSNFDALLFLTVDQMSRGISLIQDEKEKIALAGLCLLAGQRSTSRFSFPSALIYFRTGRSLLSVDDWADNYELIRELTNSCAELEYLAVTGDPSSMLKCLEDAFAYSTSFADKIRPYSTFISSLNSSAKFTEVIPVILKVLEELGESFASDASREAAEAAELTTRRALEEKSEQELTELPAMEYSDKANSMKFLSQLLYACYFSSNIELASIVVCRMIVFSLSNGLCDESAEAFVWYGWFLATWEEEIEKGYKYARVGMKLLHKSGSNVSLARVECTFNGSVAYWKEPMQALIDPVERAYDVGMAVGDLTSAGICNIVISEYEIHGGKDLLVVLKNVTERTTLLAEYKQLGALLLLKIISQCVINLVDRSEDPARLKVDGLDPEKVEASKNFPLLRFYYAYQIWMACVFGNYEMALRYLKMYSESLVWERDLYHRWPRCMNIFYGTLSALVLSRTSNNTEWKEIAEENIERMKKWAAHCPWNFQHKLELLLAERSYNLGDFEAAAQSYEVAVDLAIKRTFWNEAALAAERGFTFYRERGMTTLAKSYYSRTISLYSKWGASAKIDELQHQWKGEFGEEC